MTREQFISLVEATQKAFRRFLVALCCGDTALADDVAQESYIKAYLALDSFSNPDKFDAWIFKIGYNTFLNTRRTQRPTVVFENAKELPAQDSADSAFAYQDLFDSLNSLPVKIRTSVLLYYMQGYSIKEIAEIQSTTEVAVKQHLSRGRTQLRRLLKTPFNKKC